MPVSDDWEIVSNPGAASDVVAITSVEADREAMVIAEMRRAAEAITDGADKVSAIKALHEELSAIRSTQRLKVLMPTMEPLRLGTYFDGNGDDDVRASKIYAWVDENKKHMDTRERKNVISLLPCYVRLVVAKKMGISLSGTLADLNMIDQLEALRGFLKDDFEGVDMVSSFLMLCWLSLD